jgi:hypothetical protein
LASRLAQLGLHAFTVNAFPQGEFHGPRVKDAVFRPTWAEDSRLEHTLLAARALASLLPEGATGSLSTHTGGYKPWGAGAPTLAAVGRGFRRAAVGLAELERQTGRRIVLALEPEPLSLSETTAEIVDFFERELWPEGEVARRHLGLCFDACHQAVQYEDLPTALRLLRAAGVSIAKVQLSSALAVSAPRAAQQALTGFADERWFHQVVERAPDGSLRRFADLPEALASLVGPASGPSDGRAAGAWRIHFHVPLFAAQLDEQGLLGTTRADLQALLAEPLDAPHLEIETYSFDMIPAARRARLGAATLLECLEQEFAWVLEQLAACSRPQPY